MKHKYDIPPLGGLNLELPPQLIKRHFSPDLSGVWSINGQLARIPGKQKFCDTLMSGAVMQLFEFAVETGDKYLVAMTEDKAYWYNSATRTFDSIHDLTDFTGNADHPFSVVTFFDGTAKEIMIITNLIDAMRKWTGAGVISALGGTPPQANCLCVYENYLMCGHTTESGTLFPRRVRWSALANGESYPAENFADLRKTTDWVISLKLMRERLAVYKEKSISFMDHVGGGLTFDLVENYINGVGAISDASVVAFGETQEAHYFIGSDLNVYEFDGIDHRVIEGVDTIIKNVNPDKKPRISGTADKEDHKVIWAIPSGTDETCRDLLIYDVRDHSWWVKEAEAIAVSSFGTALLEETYTWDTLPFDTWEEWDDPGGWNSRNMLSNAPLILVGGADGYVRKLVGGVNDDGADLPSRYRYPFDNLDGSDDNLKLVNRVIIEVENKGSGDIAFQVFTDHNDQNPAAIDEDGNTSATIALSGTDSNAKFVYHSVDIAVEGYAFQWRLSSGNTAWSGRVIGIDYEITGTRIL
ncbi:MAG: hypothetical protein HKM93_08915 [Desulfobacteraceae bacterium]|nr:hypothetical protein [Desulfobacteraceae bacterium]